MMTKTDFDQDEMDILQSYEAGEWHSTSAIEKEAERLREIARAAVKKDRRINIRISTPDLFGLQARAIQDGIPYQTLISSILHKYLAGRLGEK